MGFLRVSGMVLVTALVLQYLPNLQLYTETVEHHGTVKPGWEPVLDAFKKVLSTHPHHGYAYSVYHQGNKVVDLYGGYADYRSTVPYRENTLTLLYSSTKGISALCVAMLVDRGHLDYKEKVSHYWPEFAVNGKQDITVETLLSHQAGLYTIDEGFSMYDILENPEKISRQLAEQIPAWEPGTRHGYHALTIAMYMNELITRTDPQHRTLWEFFKQELAQPLDLDVHIGLPESENYRTAWSDQPTLACLEDWNAFLLDNGWWSMYLIMRGGNLSFTKQITDVQHPLDFNDPYIRRIPLGSVGGFGTARDLAKLMGVIANGGTYNGKTYLSPKTTKMLTEALTSGRELIFGVDNSIQFGRGMTPFKSPLGSLMFGTPGAGGQMVYGDLEHKLGFGFLTNRLYSGLNMFSPQFIMLEEATYDVVKKLQK